MSIGVRGINPIWTEFDLSGKLFDGNFWLYVLENTIPYQVAPIWIDPDLSVSSPNPVQFNANGTLPIDIFFESNAIYRLEFRKNNGIDAPSQNDPLIYEINNYVANTGESTPTSTTATTTSNQITNPQFSIVNFTSSYTLSAATNPSPLEVAPGWFLEVAGTGSYTISQVALNNADPSATNAPYVLRLTLSGWNSGEVFLRQRFQQNGMLWSNKYVANSVTARIPSGLPQSISAILVDSNTTLMATVLSSVGIGSQLIEFTDNSLVIDSTNPDLPPVAYIDYKIALPSNVTIDLTSIQLAVEEVAQDISFEQDSIDRQIDHTFHYYKPGLEYKPIPSYLEAWDFPLNPAQFTNAGTLAFSAIGSNKSAYLWDQTIGFQTIADTVGLISASKDALTKGIKISTTASTSFALIQYLEASKAREILSQRNAVKLNGSVSAGTLAGTISLFWTTGATLPNLNGAGGYLSLVSSITAGVPTAGNTAGGIAWTPVTRTSFGDSATFTLTTTTTDFDFKGFDGTLGAGGTTATYFAIVIAFDTLDVANTATINYCSLVGGDIPTRPAPQSEVQVKNDCQRYYQQSFSNQNVPANYLGYLNAAFSIQGSAKNTANRYGPSVRFPVEMRAIPSVTLFNPDPSGLSPASEIFDRTANSAWVGSVPTEPSYWGFTTSGTTPILASTSTTEDGTYVHWTAKAQLGIIL